MADDARWVWLDLEMTGLDDKTCVIVQMASIITDGSFNELGMLEQTIWQPESFLEAMTPFVRKMHTDNGLLARIRASELGQQEAEQKAVEFVLQHAPFKKGILAGNSIWQDRRFLLRHMPSLESVLHYQQIDVSTIKIVAKQWYGGRGDAPGKVSSHTALEDIRASIAELKWYRDHCFVLVPG
jgi:oligoribonuclease